MLYLVTLNLAIDSLWNFLMLRYYQAVLGDDLPDPKGPLTTPSPQQATAEASNQAGTCSGNRESVLERQWFL